MKKLLLVGAGGFGRVVLEHSNKQYDCAFLDDGIVIGTRVNGATVIGKTTEMGDFYPDYTLMIVTIGNNSLREKLYKQASSIGFSFPNIIVPSAYVSPYATLGGGCVLLNNVVIQNNARCGVGCIFNPGVELHHDSSVGDYCLIYTNSVIRSLTHVGDRVWIGSTSTISTGASVPDDEVIQDGDIVKESS